MREAVGVEPAVVVHAARPVVAAIAAPHVDASTDADVNAAADANADAACFGDGRRAGEHGQDGQRERAREGNHEGAASSMGLGHSSLP